MVPWRFMGRALAVPLPHSLIVPESHLLLFQFLVTREQDLCRTTHSFICKFVSHQEDDALPAAPVSGFANSSNEFHAC